LDDTLSRKRRLLPDAIAALLLFALNILLVLPYCVTAFSSEIWNNDYLYIGIARMFGERPWTWNSLQYGGAPLQYLYPPLMPLLINLAPAPSLGLAFHMVSATGYALVPVAIYVLCRQILRSRAVAVFIAFAYGLLPSPVYWALPAWNHLAAGYHHAPWNFIALTVYSEAAHPFSTAAALFAVAAAWKGRSADELLDEFLAPFQNGDPSEDVVHLLAINDGRLLEWIGSYEGRRGNEPTPLTSSLLDFR
jgi:hypothetical protein